MDGRNEMEWNGTNEPTNDYRRISRYYGSEVRNLKRFRDFLARKRERSNDRKSS